jgi:hypothetical protein
MGVTIAGGGVAIIFLLISSLYYFKPKPLCGVRLKKM